MFGTMLIVNAVCFLPTIVLGVLSNLFELPRGAFTAVFICFLLITIANPLVQSCFRPDIKKCYKTAISCYSSRF